ncbi:MAG: M23 family metallopeptidase [Actinomycetota bacterium]
MTRRLSPIASGVATILIVAVSVLGARPADASVPGDWTWPVVGAVIRPFDAPDSPFGSGHRGIDVAAAPGTALVAPSPGTVKFSGLIAGQLFISVSHGGGWESTASWVGATSVRVGDVVFEGQPLGVTGIGHPGATIPHVHLGVKHAGAYVDPLTVFGRLSLEGLVHLAPITQEPQLGVRFSDAPVGWSA